MTPSLRRLAAPVALAVLAPCVQAQMIDDVDLRREGADAVMAVRFVTPVVYRSSLTARSGDAVQVLYDVLAAPTVPQLVVSERRVDARGTLPEIIVTDDSATRSANSMNRRLVVRLDTPVPVRVRAGRGDRTIEFVLKGMASALAPTLPNAVAALPPREAPQVAAAPAPAPAPAVPPASAAIASAPAAPASAPAAPVPAPTPAVPAPVPPVPAPPPVAAVAPEPAGSAPAPAVAQAALTPTAPTGPELEAQAAALLAAAKAADTQGDVPQALNQLNQLLNLPPNPSTREAQALAGDLRLKSGDSIRARAEYETFLRLYPTGPDADRVRQALASLPAPSVAEAAPRQRPPVQPSSTLAGSLSAFYYGGQSKVRTQEFQDSPISGLPELATDNTLSGVDNSQLMTNVDVNWRYRDADKDMRFVFRDAYTEDFHRSDKSRNRLSALYFEHRALQLGTQIKLGRQSPTGGGVLERFDGVQAGYSFAPKWRVNAVAGVPTTALADSRRHFYGAWVEADQIVGNLGGGLYVNQGLIDGEVDRRAVGTELRYFSGGVSMTSILDYDQVIRGLNIASLQGTWQREDNTVVNFLYDRRATPLLMLGNALFFGTLVPAPTATDPNAMRMATSIRDLLDSGFQIDTLRHNVKATTTYTTQGLLGITTPLAKNWQVGGDVRVTKLGDIPPIPDILPNGQGRSDNNAVGLQLIGTNLYSNRDTHVISASLLKGSSETKDPTLGSVMLDYTGELLSYNNSSQLNELWLLEPSIKFYFQHDSSGVKTQRVSPGLRVTYRMARQFSIESELSGEYSKTTGPTRNETANRVFYYLGGRYDF